MKLHIVALRDIKANCFSQPQFVPSIGSYLRQLGDEVNTPRQDNILNKHPEDFEAYHMGDYDDSNGRMELKDEYTQIAVCSNMVIQK